MQNKNKIIIILLVAVIVILAYGAFIKPKNGNDGYQIPVGDTKGDADATELNAISYTYTNHGFSIELPKGYVPVEQKSEGGPATSISLPNNSHLSYVTDAAWWEQYNILPSYTYIKDEKIGAHTFKVYSYGNFTFYWFKQGNVGYEFVGDIELLKTFKFVGWSQ
ncbi:hypothetical protein A2645_01025 [Candidatus Nomurabacteria bacterium RIFCSPHIGHO2_01_FULL_39_9]|uniref:Uncharacterized protein n=1 Tax=Candidatus Nomurabacteria bacterium RIFCSPHIGHO2_01_FULL_39_9 TaxID=1801735 RepID=A0A1F6UWM9_9BACT|nr:MAG: hypothetical protein A2645_01025 [Candidatus Nomurabacteria bacterium RIFCSPHIGHO2_01_FULL_39_9]